MFHSNLKLSLCRTCLVNISQTNVFNIFNTLDLAKKLMECSGLAVEPADKYPENICLQCYEKIVLFYEFQQMCCKSIITFNELLQNKDTLITQSDKGKIQPENPAKDPENKDLKLVNHLREQPIEAADDKEIFKEFLKKKKRGRPPNKKSQVPKPERKTMIGRSSRSITRKTIDTSSLKGERTQYLQCNAKSGIIIDIKNSFLKPESLDNHVYENTQEEKEEKSLTDMENCSSALDLTSAQKQNHQCDRCSKSYKALHRLEAHMRQHDGLTPYTCTLEGCKRTFNRWYFYNKHQKEHNVIQEQSFRCDLDQCERVYKNKSALNIHKRKFHKFGPELKTHMCEICGKVFKSSAVLNDHHYTHIDKAQLPYACDEDGCVKRFSNKEKLKVHKMRHAGIKNFICPYCGMRKTTRNELKIHINYHTLEKTWSCRFCPKVCNSAGNLKMHVKNMHERAKDFACRYCEQTFAKADTKKYHEMTHTGEKPHECKECGRRFIQPAALRTHRKIHIRQKEKLRENQKCKKPVVTEKIQNTIKKTNEAN